uniref:Polyprenal reductase n=1 Tax=Rhipicephalus microplus TaxID=6941 RepID=A0A6G4ZZC1_RHIMP
MVQTLLSVWSCHLHSLHSIHGAVVRFGLPLPGAVIKLVNFFEPRPTGTVSATSILLVQLLETCQVYRRCYECMFVSVYSNVRMHVWHYLMGYFFYFGVQLTILANAPISSGSTLPRFSLTDISAHHVIGTAVFLGLSMCSLTLTFAWRP